MLRKIVLIAIALIVTFGSFVIVGTIAKADASAANGLFPTKVGTQFAYVITIGEYPPVIYREYSWVEDHGEVLQVKRGLFPGQMDDSSKTTFDLVLQVASDPIPSGPLIAWEMSIVTDTLGIYAGVDQLYWIYNPKTDVLSELMAVSSYKAPSGVKTSKVGMYVRMLVTPSEDGPVKQFDYSRESMTLEDVDTNGVLHVRRNVPAIEEHNDFSFTEDMYWTPGRGMTLFVQEIAGHGVTMTMKLVDPKFMIPKAAPVSPFFGS